MGLSTQTGDITFRDGVVNMSGALGLTVPIGSIGDTAVTATSPLGTTKTRRRFTKTYQQSNGSANVADQKIVHIVYGAIGALIAVRAGIRTACVAPSKTTIDVKKNGVSILTAPFDVTSAFAAFALVAGSVAVAGLVAGDVLEVVITLTGGGTQGQGLFVDLVIDEDPA